MSSGGSFVHGVGDDCPESADAKNAIPPQCAHPNLSARQPGDLDTSHHRLPRTGLRGSRERVALDP